MKLPRSCPNRRLSLLYSLLLLPGLAWSGESCNALINLGLYNVSQSSNATDAESLSKSTFCSADYSKAETSQSQKAQIEASYGLFSGGAGGSQNSSSIITKQTQTCTSGFDSSKYSNTASSYSKTVYQGTLDAWNKCQALAGKGIDFDVQTPPSLTSVTVAITAGAGNANTFLGLRQGNIGRANCSMTLPAQGNSLSGRVINVNESTSFNFSAASKVIINCQRELKTSANGDLSADAVDLVFNTSAESLVVPLAGIGSLSRVSVDQAMAQIKTAVSSDTTKTVNQAIAGLDTKTTLSIADLDSKIKSSLAWYGGVSMPDLQKYHGGCAMDFSKHAECTSAAHNWCVANNKGSLGDVEEWDGPGNALGIGCIK